jgi:t-SNARE complex subunit (syntaxin)
MNQELADLVPSMSEGVRLLEEFGFQLQDQQPKLNEVELKLEKTDENVSQGVANQADGV